MFFKTIFFRTCRLGLFFCCFSICHVKAVTLPEIPESSQGTTFPVTAEVHNTPISPDQGESSSPVHRPVGKATIFQHVTPSAPSEESVPSSGHSLEFEEDLANPSGSWIPPRGWEGNVDRETYYPANFSDPRWQKKESYFEKMFGGICGKKQERPPLIMKCEFRGAKCYTDDSRIRYLETFPPKKREKERERLEKKENKWRAQYEKECKKEQKRRAKWNKNNQRRRYHSNTSDSCCNAGCCAECLCEACIKVGFEVALHAVAVIICLPCILLANS